MNIIPANNTIVNIPHTRRISKTLAKLHTPLKMKDKIGIPAVAIADKIELALDT